MGAYRTYSNGIQNARRYKGYYIVRETTPVKSFKVLNEDKEMVVDHLPNADEGIWEITKLLLDDETKNLVKAYAEMDMFVINKLFLDMSKEKQQPTFGPKDKKKLELLDIIRNRRLKNLSVDI